MESGTIEVKCECSITRFKSKQFCQNQNGWQVCKYTCRSLYSLLLKHTKSTIHTKTKKKNEQKLTD